MKLLAIDTSTMRQSIAILDGSKVLCEINPNVDKTHSSNLISNIKKLVEEHIGSFSSIDCLAFSQGPGSFTGLRIGATTMISLAMINKLPLISVSSTMAIAMNVKKNDVLVSTLIDARMKQVYFAQYEINKNETLPKELIEPKIIYADKLEQLFNKNSMILGDGFIKYKEQIEKIKGIHLEPGSSDYNFPKASSVGLIAYEKFANNDFQIPNEANIHLFEPLYMRPSEAERNKENKGT
ncbi:MAG: tRNA (adenosine(37)-N6)-threonylcarbamoyltransferase complex dimerization subunit type 1 TsaB [Pseudomonadota bacterium]